MMTDPQVFRAPEKDLRVETMRGVAIALMVAYHVTLNKSYFDGAAFKAIRESLDVLGVIRMPLFAALSGIVYAMRPLGGQRVGEFIWEKANRLLVPTFFAIIVDIGSRGLHVRRSAGFGSRKQIPPLWHFPFFEFPIFWFVQAAFAIFIVFALIERKGWLDTPSGFLRFWIAAFVLAFFSRWFEKQFDRHDLEIPFAITKAIYLLPFFTMGVGFVRFREAALGRGLLWTAYGLSAFCLMVAWQRATAGIGFPSKETLPGILSSFGLVYVFLRFCPANRPLAWIGQFAFTIYLYHFAVLMSGLAVMRSLGLETAARTWIGLPAVAVVAVAVPIGLHAAALRHPWSRRLLLGIRPRRQHAQGRLSRSGDALVVEGP